jgi:hypothetical protein
VKRKIENPFYRVAKLVNKELKIQEKVSLQLLAQTRGNVITKKVEVMMVVESEVTVIEKG